MENSFRQILLPTILTSSVVFYAATSAFISFAPRSVDGSSIGKGRLQYAPSKDYKESTIRSVGLCILGSVGTGLVVAEAIRRQQAANKRNKLKYQLTEPSISGPASSTDGVESDAENGLNLAAISANSTINLASEVTSRPDSELSQPQHIGRIRVPHRHQSLFAILLDQQYYSFTKAENSFGAAQKIAARLSNKGDRVVMTYTSGRYVVWTWEPQAEPDA